jgi:hypothetical protein
MHGADAGRHEENDRPQQIDLHRALANETGDAVAILELQGAASLYRVWPLSPQIYCCILRRWHCVTAT